MSDTRGQKLDGEPALVRSKGEKYQRIADAITRATVTLGKIVDDTNTTAKSMDATRTLASDVRDDIRKATDRYRTTGDALVTYASPLDTAIQDSETAAQQLAALEGELTTARNAAQNARWHQLGLAHDASDDDIEDARNAVTRTHDRVSGLEDSVTYWLSKWDEAKSHKDRAATTARNAIDEVVSGSRVHGLKDSTWDQIKDVASSVYKVFKMICDVAGILAIFLSWVPILGEVLLVLAAIGSVLDIIETVVQFAQGDIGWGGLLLGVGLGVVGLFGGKLASTLGKVAKARAVTKAVEVMGSESAVATRVAGSLDEGLDVIATANTTVAHADELLSLKSVLRSPFVRSDAMDALFDLRKAGRLSVLEGLRSAAKEAFVMPLKSPFGDTGELFRNPTLYDNMDHLAGWAVSAQLADFGASAAKAGIGFSDAFSGDGDAWSKVNSVIGLAGPITDGPYVAIAQMPGKVVEWADTFDRMV